MRKCYDCGSTDLASDNTTLVEFNGLPVTYLVGATSSRCRDCGSDQGHSIRAMGPLLDALAADVASRISRGELAFLVKYVVGFVGDRDARYSDGDEAAGRVLDQALDAFHLRGSMNAILPGSRREAVWDGASWTVRWLS